MLQSGVSKLLEPPWDPYAPRAVTNGQAESLYYTMLSMRNVPYL